ncbi:MAG: 2-oxoacid:acceptor oxidoreductase family protein [Calditrichia bacterium]
MIKKGRTEIRLSGSGGQGLILGGVILAEAAILDNYNAVQSQSYGPEARGGSSKSDVVISKEKILYPKATKLDILLALNQESCDAYASYLKDKGLLFVDEDAVEHLPPGQYVRLPLVRTAREKIGKVMTTNILSLGVIVGVTKIVSEKSLIKAVMNRIPKGTEALNMKAIKTGLDMGKRAAVEMQF